MYRLYTAHDVLSGEKLKTFRKKNNLLYIKYIEKDTQISFSIYLFPVSHWSSLTYESFMITSFKDKTEFVKLLTKST